MLALYLWVCRWWFLTRDSGRRSFLRALLRVAARRLADDTTGLVWWIDFGTLLGFVREGDVIDGDNDVDICVRVESDGERERLWSLVRSMAEQKDDHGVLPRQIQAVREPWVGARCFRLSYVFGAWGHIDFYHNVRPHVDEGVGGYPRWYLGATGDNSNVREDWIGQPQRVPWPRLGPDVSVCIPQHPERVLEWRYGEDWRVPRPNFKGRDA